MNEHENVLVDFTLTQKKRRYMLYFKRPAGAAIPVGEAWRCICGSVNILNANPEQYCGQCGSRVRLQENLDANNTYYTCVIVSHFTPARSKNSDKK